MEHSSHDYGSTQFYLMLVDIEQRILRAAEPRGFYSCDHGILYLQGQPQSRLVAFVQLLTSSYYKVMGFFNRIHIHW